MGLLKEFKDFAMRGNVIDMAVGVIIGGAFGKIVTSMVNDILTPVIGIFANGKSLAGSHYPLAEASDGTTLYLEWGNFVQNIIDFMIVAACLFAVIKVMNTAKKRFEKEEAATPPPAPKEEIVLLTQIRDALRQQ